MPPCPKYNCGAVVEEEEEEEERSRMMIYNQFCSTSIVGRRSLLR